MEQLPKPTSKRNSDLLLPYLVPYGAYVGIAAAAGGLGREADYTLRIVVVGIALILLRKQFQRITGPKSSWTSVAIGVAAGVVGVLVWIGLVLPFQDPTAGEPFTTSAFLFRLVAAVLIVPLAEELLFRGYLFGVVTQWRKAQLSGASDPTSVALDESSVHEISPGAWTAVAVLVSSAAFALGHAPAQWAAAFGYGALMAALWIWRGDLLTPIIAHATTNLVLYLYIFNSQLWGLW